MLCVGIITQHQLLGVIVCYSSLMTEASKQGYLFDQRVVSQCDVTLSKLYEPMLYQQDVRVCPLV